MSWNPQEIARGLGRAEKWCVSVGAARYGTKYDAWQALKSKGCAYAHDHGPTKRVGRWTWRLTPLGQQVRAALAQPAAGGDGDGR
jgi:hypothetical protein